MRRQGVGTGRRRSLLLLVVVVMVEGVEVPTEVSSGRQNGKDDGANDKISEFLGRRQSQQEEADADLGQAEGDKTQRLGDEVQVKTLCDI